MRPTLRPYQISAIESAERVLQAARAVLLVAPTGAGKTLIAAEIIQRASDAGRRVLFLAPRRELIVQTCEKVDALGLAYGVLLAGSGGGNAYAGIQIASIDTLMSRALRRSQIKMEFDLIIIDEAHLGLTAGRRRLLDLWPAAKLIGLTATPVRGDGKALGGLYDELVEVTTPAELTELGFLVPARYFSVSKPDLSGVRVTAGDFNQLDLDKAMNRPRLVGNIVQHWLEHAGGRRTVVFASSIVHSAALAKEFVLSGVAAEHVSANTPGAERDAIIKRFRNGRTQVLTNAVLASIGFDVPDVSCVVLARPTRSLGLYLQMLGRGLRPAAGKIDCLVLDHSGVVHRHGFVTDERFWTLHGTYAQDPVTVREAEAAREKTEGEALECPQCSALWRGGLMCPSCQFTFPPRAKPVAVRDGRLVELNSGTLSWPAMQRKQFFFELWRYGVENKWARGAAAHKFKNRFGDWPDWAWNNEAERTKGAPTTLETRRWIRAQQEAYRRALLQAEAG